MENLLQNQLFLQYLSGAGSALSAGEPIGPALNQVTQQQISSQNYMKMLQKMLGKGVEFKSDAEGKATVTGELSKILGAEEGEDVFGGQFADQKTQPLGGASLQTPQLPATQNQQLNMPEKSGLNQGGIMSLLNPSSSPLGNFSPSDLAGLTPKDISEALKFKFAGEELGDKRINDAVDRAYKQTQITGATPSITIPGTDVKLTRKEYISWFTSASKDERTAAVKNYEFAQSKGYKGDFESFQNSASTSQQKNFESAKKDGYVGSFNEWMLDMAKAGAINLGDIVARQEATKDVSAKKYFTDPKGLVQDVDKYVSSDEVQNELFQYADTPQSLEREKVRRKEQFIEGKITSSGGTIIEARLDKKTFIWKVKWPDGTTSEVKYAN